MQYSRGIHEQYDDEQDEIREVTQAFSPAKTVSYRDMITGEVLVTLGLGPRTTPVQ